jgi:linoleate 10R-lipoxygenase
MHECPNTSLTHSPGHSTVSKPEERWTEDLFTKTFPSPLKTITIPEFREVTQQLKDKINSDITKWTFDGLQRDENGRFRDADLACILQDGTANPAGAFKARGIPSALRIIEVMTIKQARAWGCCTVGMSYSGVCTY